jgi:iron complex transport system substrate-binding protein
MTHARPIRYACLALALALAAAACGSGDDDDGGASAGGQGEAAGDATGFPVTVEHKYGSTTVESPPERVVTVGLTDQDSVLALGVTPVGVTDWFGDHPNAVWPWAQDELEDVGGEPPEVIGDSETINFERIARLRPDVILALYSGLTDDDYETLSEIAPTVAQPADYPDYGIPWQDQTRTIGEVLGRADEADAAVQGVEDEFAAAREAHPEFDGSTALVATPYQGSISVFAPTDPRGRFLDALGFRPVDAIVDLIGDGFSADLSMEQVDLIDVDAIVWIVEDVRTDLPRLHDEPLYGRMDVARQGREVPVANLSELGGATSFVTVLSLPVLIDNLVPMLAEAVDGDPATQVEQPA